jgi:predicted RND superfamily exporter protein
MQHSKRKDIMIVLVAVILAAASLSTIGMLHVDSSTDVFIPKQDPVNKINDQIEDQFGSLDAIIIGLSVDNGTILNKESLTLLEKLTNEIEDLEFVAQVISLTKTDHMEAGLDGFEVVPLYTGTTDEQIIALKEKIESWSDVYEGALISDDQKMVAMVVQPNKGLTQTQIESLLDSIQVLLNDNKKSDQQFSILGLPSVKKQINRSLLSDVAILAPIAGLLIILVLLFSFRRLAGIILPLAGLLISASITLGIMAILQITFTMATMLVPVLLLIVGSAYAIHVMSHFYAEIALTKGAVSYDDTVQIIDMVLKRNTLPIIMAGATTAAGFIAQLTSPLGPFRTFGLLSAVGVILSQISSLYLLPAMLRLTYHNGVRMEKVNLGQEIKSNKFYSFLEKSAIKGKVPLVAVSLILFVVTIMLIPKINVGTNMIKFFSKSSSLVQDTERYNKHMAGSGILTIMIDGKESSSILEPSFLNTLDQFSAEIEKIENVGKVQTVTPYIKRMNYLMNQDNPPYRQTVVEQAEFDFFGDSFGFFDDFEEVEDETTTEFEAWDPATYIEIPSEPAKYGLETTDDLKALLSQYLLLYAGNLDQLINDDVEPSATLITVQMRDSDSNYLRTVKESIDSFWSENLPSGWTYMVGGGDAISLAIDEINHNLDLELAYNLTYSGVPDLKQVLNRGYGLFHLLLNLTNSLLDLGLNRMQVITSSLYDLK